MVAAYMGLRWCRASCCYRMRCKARSNDEMQCAKAANDDAIQHGGPCRVALQGCLLVGHLVRQPCRVDCRAALHDIIQWYCKLYP